MAAIRDPKTGQFKRKPSVKVETEWHGEAILGKLKTVEDRAIKKIALQTEAQAKVNIHDPFPHADGEERGQVDTGAMVNSTRAVFAGSAGKLPRGVLAAVISPMSYAVWQEILRPFLLPAAMQIGKETGNVYIGFARREGLL